MNDTPMASTSAEVVAPGTEEEPEEQLGPAEHAPVEQRFPLDIRKAEYSIFELHRRWDQGHLRLDPDFQRTFVWTQEKQIKLVESVLALIPLPVIYLSDDGESLEVVDGQQRLTTLFAFMEGRFADKEGPEVILRRRSDPARGRRFELRDLRLLKELDGQTFESLDAKTRRKFEETQLTCFVLHPKTSPQAKFELFERINEGTTPLNPQEIRNALFRGPGLELVRQLAAEGSRFRSVAGEKRKYRRMRADELVLRGIAFAWRGWSGYRGDLKVFLNDTLQKLNESDREEHARVRSAFLHAVDFAEKVFGDRAWQRFDIFNGWSGHISGPLVEAVTHAAVRVFAERLPSDEQAKRIRDSFEQLCGEPQFNNAVIAATQTVQNVKVRMDALERICRDAK